MREKIALIWFTGIISQYNLSSYDIPNLKINHNLLNKIQQNYNADKYIALINVRNDIEKRQYLDLIKKEHLESKLIFVICDMSESIENIISTLNYSYEINYYIDCSRRRLIKMVDLIDYNKLIHISQLLD